MSSATLIGLAGSVLVAVAWLTVQLAWGRVFPEPRADPDVLAGRTSCSGCADPATCPNNNASSCPDR